MAGLNVKGNKSFSSNYFCRGKFVSMHTTTNHPCIITLHVNEMSSLYSSALFCAWQKFHNKKEHWCVLSEKCCLICQMFLSTKVTCSVPCLCTIQWKVDKFKFAYMYLLNSTCPLPWYVHDEILTLFLTKV